MCWTNVLFYCVLLGSQVVFGLPSKDARSKQSKGTSPLLSRDSPGIFNWYGTSLFGFDGCDDIHKSIRGWIKEAYADAIKLVDFDGVKQNINWDSAAALEFLGPSAFNKDQQKQIQAVLANVATVKPGSSLWTPNWIRVRCDDPGRRCSTECPTSKEDEFRGDVLAYARNPKQAGAKYPDISFCPKFYGLRNLGNAIAYGSAPSNPKSKYDLRRYMGRADTFLHELLHLDLAANSVMGNPNPNIRDLKIRYKYVNSTKNEVSSRWTTAYGPALAKILARFQPASASSKQTGYFVQRNDDNLVSFALANYVQRELKHYPYAPVIYNMLADAPLLPPTREYSIVFSPDGGRLVSFNNHTAADTFRVPGTNEDGEACPAFSEDGKGEDLEIGAPIPANTYPKSYWDQRQKWLEELKASNVCMLRIREIWTCEPSDKNLYAAVRLEDASGKVAFDTPESTHSPGLPINDQDPLELKETGLKHSLRITGEHTGDYIQFTYGSTKWTSGTKSGRAHCKLQGEDWDNDGPGECPTAALSRKFDCEFPCD